MPAAPASASVAHPLLVVHRVDERDEAERLRRADAAPRDARIVEAGRPGAARTADRDGEADVLHRAEAGAKRARLLERGALEADEDVVGARAARTVRATTRCLR